MTVMIAILVSCIPLSGGDDPAAMIEAIRAKHDLPGMVAGVVTKDGLVESVDLGVRKRGEDTRVTINDKFHIGSCTKAMTATMIATLVEQGKLRWDLTIGEALKDADSPLKEATLEMLLTQRAGFPGPEKSWPEGRSFLDMHNLSGNGKEQREAYAALALRQKPEYEIGSRFVYSNMGYVIAGAMAERAMDAQYEDLMRKHLFAPLKMASAGFGPAGEDQPWPHREDGTAVFPSRLSDNPPVVAPAGTAHMSLPDWAKFVSAHLLRSESLLKPETYARLHTPAHGGYAYGWLVADRPWAGGNALNHAGSNTMNFCVAWVAPSRGFAVIVATNQGGDKAAVACSEAAGELIGWWTSRH